jgi:hypothetical protein
VSQCVPIGPDPAGRLLLHLPREVPLSLSLSDSLSSISTILSLKTCKGVHLLKCNWTMTRVPACALRRMLASISFFFAFFFWFDFLLYSRACIEHLEGVQASRARTRTTAAASALKSAPSRKSRTRMIALATALSSTYHHTCIFDVHLTRCEDVPLQTPRAGRTAAATAPTNALHRSCETTPTARVTAPTGAPSSTSCSKRIVPASACASASNRILFWTRRRASASART